MIVVVAAAPRGPTTNASATPARRNTSATARARADDAPGATSPGSGRGSTARQSPGA